MLRSYLSPLFQWADRQQLELARHKNLQITRSSPSDLTSACTRTHDFRVNWQTSR